MDYSSDERERAATAAHNRRYNIGQIYTEGTMRFYFQTSEDRDDGLFVRLDAIPAKLLERQDTQLMNALKVAGLSFEWSTVIDDQGRTWTYGEESWNLPLVQLELL